MGKEILQQRGKIELTSKANSLKLRGGVIYMPADGAAEFAPRPNSRIVKPQHAAVLPISSDGKLIHFPDKPVRSDSLPVETGTGNAAALIRLREEYLRVDDPSVPQFVRNGARKVIEGELERLGIDLGSLSSQDLMNFVQGGESEKPQTSEQILKEAKRIVHQMTGRNPDGLTESEIIEAANAVNAALNARLEKKDAATIAALEQEAKRLLDKTGDLDVVAAGTTPSSGGSGTTSGSASASPTGAGGMGGRATGGPGGPAGPGGPGGPGVPPPPVPPPPGTPGTPATPDLGGSFSLYLSDNDRDVLRTSPAGWISSQFDMIYSSAEQGNEANSTFIQVVQQKFSFALDYLTQMNVKGYLDTTLGTDPVKRQEIITGFGEEFSVRLNLMLLRSVIEHKSIEQVQQYTQVVGAHGLLYALHLDEGAVGKMWSRIDERMEEERLSQQAYVEQEATLFSEWRDQTVGLSSGEKEDLLMLIRQTLKVPLVNHHGEDKGNKYKNERQAIRDRAKPLLDPLFARSVTGGPFEELYQEAQREVLAHRLDAGNVEAWVKSNILKTLEVNVRDRDRIARDMGRFHVSEEMMERLQGKLINEQYLLASTGGPFRDYYDEVRAKGLTGPDLEREVKVRITRAVRTAYDAWVVSQRQGVVVARGHALEGTPILKSDPITIFTPFNLEEYGLHRKQLSSEAIFFLEELELAYARSELGEKAKSMKREDLLSYGMGKFRDVAEVSDFFSSSWRIMGTLESLRARVAYENGLIDGGDTARVAAGLSRRTQHIDSEDFALFLKLPKAENTPETELRLGQYEKLPQWLRIAEIRPEEMIRFYRERVMRDPRTEYDKNLAQQFGKFFTNPAFDGLKVYKVDSDGIEIRDDAHVDYFRTYDKFKQRLGPLIQSLRQDGYKQFRALRIGEEIKKDGRGFNLEDKQRIIDYFTANPGELAAVFGPRVTADMAPDKIKDMFAHFKTIALTGVTLDPATGGRTVRGGSVIGNLMDGNGRFEDIHRRSAVVDDALLEMLENPPDPEKSGLVKLSKSISHDKGQDGLVRAYNDLTAGIEGNKAFVAFLREEKAEKKLEAAMAIGEACYNYSGQDLRAKAIRYTYGSFIGLSAEGFWWDAIGFKKGPFRTSISTIEKIYGVSAQPMTVDDRMHAIDELQHAMIGSIDRNASEREVNEQIHKAEELVDGLRRAAHATGKDVAKRRSVSFMFYLLLACFVEGYQIVDQGFSGKAA